jgi:ribosomal protein L15
MKGLWTESSAPPLFGTGSNSGVGEAGAQRREKHGTFLKGEYKLMRSYSSVPSCL